jgi:threonine/homoserine/homoserine lactone efflux protein
VGFFHNWVLIAETSQKTCSLKYIFLLGEVVDVNIALLGAFWSVSMLFVIIPGADWAYAITAGLKSSAIPAVGGLLAGHFSATIIVAAGVGALIAGVPAAMTVLTVAGSLYLIYLGFATLRRPASPSADDSVPARSVLRWFLRGFGVSGLNPKVFLLFLAVLPQFTSAAAVWPVAIQILVLGAVHIVNCAIVYSVVSISARAVLGARPRAAIIVSRISGAAMVAIGLFLLVDRLRALLMKE